MAGVQGGEQVFHLNYPYPVRYFATRSEWETYACWLRRHARVSLALLPEPPRPPMRPRIFDRWQGREYTCEKVFLESLPGFYVTGNLFRPLNRSYRRIPAVLCPHGHWRDGRLHDHDPRGSVPARCIQLARMGAIVFSYDMVGYNDSCQLPHGEFPEDHIWGLSLMALQTWNSMRALDFLLSLPEVDERRIGMTGASGGASQTFALGAVDERLTAVAPICMVSYHMQGGCLCENAPLLRLDATNVELTRLFAPKPLFLGSCTGDWTKNTPRVEMPAVRSVYRFYRAEHCLSGLHLDAGHNYNQAMREAVYGFFNRWLFGARTARPIKEEPVPAPPLRAQMVWWGRSAPPPLTGSEFQRLWRKRTEAALRPHLRDADTVRRDLAPLLLHVLGLTFTSPASEVASQVGQERGRPESFAIRAAGEALVVAPQRGCRPSEPNIRFYTTYNLAPLARDVHEILAAIEGSGGVRSLVGKGRAGMACLLAAAISPRCAQVEADLCGFDPARPSEWAEHLPLPGIRQIGGLAPVFALLRGRKVVLRHAPPKLYALARHLVGPGIAHG